MNFLRCYEAHSKASADVSFPLIAAINYGASESDGDDAVVMSKFSEKINKFNGRAPIDNHPSLAAQLESFSTLNDSAERQVLLIGHLNPLFCASSEAEGAYALSAEA